MSLSELIKSVAYGDKGHDKGPLVPCVPSAKNHMEQLQPPSHAVVPCVPPVPRRNIEVESETEAQNDDADLRMSWLVLMDGKPARVVGTRKRSYAEVLRSVQSRWPEYNVEVVK